MITNTKKIKRQKKLIQRDQLELCCRAFPVDIFTVLIHKKKKKNFAVKNKIKR